jgi:hypothetical protein
LFTSFSDVSDDRLQSDDLGSRSPYGDTYAEYDDDFMLDCDSLATTPALTTAFDDECKTTSDISITHRVPAFNSNPKNAPDFDEGAGNVHFEMEIGGQGTVAFEMEEQDDDMKELDAWLNSGAVEIIG